MRDDTEMMGVVLWSDPDEQKAVFWCEDHGDLAYFDGTTSTMGGRETFNPGDMVEFTVTLERKVRRANNARLIEARVCNDLQDHLRNTAGQTADEPRFSASNVVELPHRLEQRRPA